MISGKATVKNASGMHIIPSQQFAFIASGFECLVTVKAKTREADGKSILDMMTLNARLKEVLTITCDGPDEKECLAALTKYTETFRSNYK